MMQRAGAIVEERILVVDDEEAIREIVSSLLVSANYNCQQAGSGNEALAVLNSGERFDLISTDLMMADLDGLALLEKVNVQYPEIPVIFVTSVHDPSVALMCSCWCIRLLAGAIRARAIVRHGSPGAQEPLAQDRELPR